MTTPLELLDSPLDRARGGIDLCVHCGFCLQSCPTYLVLEDENDSPRGRILLMRAALEGTLPIDDPSVTTHIDQCLGCRACEPVCPSGVPYGHLLEATRATIAERRPLPLVARAILAVFARRSLLRVTMAASRLLRATRIPALLARIPGRFGFAMAMLDATRPSLRRQPYAVRELATQGDVTLLTGCVMDGLFSETNRATLRTLRVNGHASVETTNQGCCGALHAHAGDLEGARALARRNIAAFEKARNAAIVVNAAGCGAMMRDYPSLLADDVEWRARAVGVAARVHDVTELLAAAGPAPGAASDELVTYDAPCHLLHAQRIVAPPLAVIAASGAELTPLSGSEHCCGAAGIYNLLQPAVSDAVLTPKLANIAATGASLVVTGNPGCHMQIGAGLLRAGIAARTVHPVDLLDASYARTRGA